MSVERIAVIGAGTMGHGIAQVAARAGFQTVLCDVGDELVAAALARIRAGLEKGVERGKVEPGEVETTLARLATSTSLTAAAAEADLIIEAIPEDMAVKRDLFARLETAAPPAALLATNTSSLSVATIAAVLADPGRLLGMHFFNPVHAMKLVEIVTHEANPAAAVETAVAVAERLGKTAIVVKDVPGFATSRLGVLLGLEAMRMLEQGVASARDIDTAMVLGYRHPMGPLELTDLVGLDVRLAIAEYLHEELGEAFRPPEVLRRLVDEGKLGKKSGEGFYKW
ncbi:MAG TPA: 3-hydroxyacyl-CoA dehydrogenase family protein [Acidobacteriota bacterium]